MMQLKGGQKKQQLQGCSKKQFSRLLSGDPSRERDTVCVESRYITTYKKAKCTKPIKITE